MSTYLAYLQFTLSDHVSRIMVFDIIVLHRLIEHLIFCKVYRTWTVIKRVNARIITTKLNLPMAHLYIMRHGYFIYPCGISHK
jgi:hypothetical protein